MPDTKISSWLETEGQYVSRVTLGKHRRDHLTSEFEKSKSEAIKIMEDRKKTLKPSSGKDLAGLVRDYTLSSLESGEIVPTLAEGLRAQEIIDKRAEKSSDRNLAITIASILGGTTATYQVIDAKQVEQIDSEV